MKSYVRAFLYGAIAAGVYFSLALWTNRMSPWPLRLKASLGHGLLCWLLTFTSTSLMEFNFNIPKKRVAKYFFSVLASGLCVLTLMTGVHLYLGTPNIVGTLFYSALTSLPYYLLFPLKLLSEHKKEMSQGYRQKSFQDGPWDTYTFSSPYNAKDLYQVFKYNLLPPLKDKRDLKDSLPQSYSLYNPQGDLQEKKQTATKIAFFGDLMPMYKKKLIFTEEVKEQLKDIDYLVCNFEGTFDSDGTVFLAQCHSEQILNDLKEIIAPEKVVFSLANNHAADFGPEHLLKTVKKLESQKFNVIGLKGKESLIIGDGINLVAATQWTNQPHGYLSFIEDASAHISSKHFNILYPHWGYEMEYYPRQPQIDQAKNYLKKWDMIIGHHSHLPGHITTYSHGESEREKLVAYSLGDTSTALPRRRYRFGMIVLCDFYQDENQCHELSHVAWFHTHLRKDRGDSMALHKITPQEFMQTRQ